MDFESEPEKKTTSSSSPTAPSMTLQKAIEMGEYNPQFLSTFPEWLTLPRHSQFQHIRQALENRRRHLTVQWAEIVNVLDFTKKPNLQQALRNIEAQLERLNQDKERLYLEYSK